MRNVIALSVLSLAMIAAPALAQRDPAYAAAKASGEVGEQPDGYIGIAGGGAGLQSMVNNINIQRKAAYTKQAAANGATVEQFAFTTGCNLIAQTRPGEKYKGPDGSWKTRTGAPPERDSRCV